LFGGAQVPYVPDVQQIKAAISQRDGIAPPAPLCHTLPQFFASKNLVCDGFSPNSIFPS
jgi:hypothetical protein